MAARKWKVALAVRLHACVWHITRAPSYGQVCIIQQVITPPPAKPQDLCVGRRAPPYLEQRSFRQYLVYLSTDLTECAILIRLLVLTQKHSSLHLTTEWQTLSDLRARTSNTFSHNLLLLGRIECMPIATDNPVAWCVNLSVTRLRCAKPVVRYICLTEVHQLQGQPGSNCPLFAVERLSRSEWIYSTSPPSVTDLWPSKSLFHLLTNALDNQPKRDKTGTNTVFLSKSVLLWKVKLSSTKMHKIGRLLA